MRIDRLAPHVVADVPTRPSAGAVDGLARRRLAATYLAPGKGPVKVAFFDADATLRVALSGGATADGPGDVALLPNVARTLGRLSREGYLIAIVSNQAGVSAGRISLEDADAALEETVELIRKGGGDVHWVDFAERKDSHRKPAVGMALSLETFLKETFGDHAVIDKKHSFMVGDSAYTRREIEPDGERGDDHSDADRLFAQNLGVSFQDPADFFGWRTLGVDGFRDIRALEAFRAAHERNARRLIGGG